LRHRLERNLSLFRRDAGLQSRNRVETNTETPFGIQLFGIRRSQPQRKEDIRASPRQFKVRRKNARHPNALAIQFERPAHDVRVGAETARPEGVADQCNRRPGDSECKRRRATQLVVRCEVAASHDLDAENPQQVVLHERAVQSFRLFFRDIADSCVSHRRRHGFKGPWWRLPLLDIHAGQQLFVSQGPIRLGIRHSYRNQSVRTRIRQTPEQDAIQRAEQGSRRSQSQGEDEDRRQGESRAAAPRSHGISRILVQRVPERSNPDAPHILSSPVHVTETATRLCRLDAVALGAHRNVRIDFFADIFRRRASSKPASQAHPSTLRTPSLITAQLCSISFRRRRPFRVSR